MREILFRGKQVNNSEWVYGYLLANKLGTCIIIEENPHEEIYVYAKVIPETVGQYTGLKDKNGKRIFEGDIICDSSDTFNFAVKYGTSCPVIIKRFCQEFNLKKAHTVFGLYAHNKFGDYFLEDNKSTTIIGNIHDNPELLKEV